MWAWRNYLGVVQHIAEGFGNPDIIEIGGGRAPSFEPGAIPGTYTSNDISERELSLGPDWVAKARFDVQTPDENAIRPYRESYDVAFSRMVMEHVPSYERAYRNIHTILRPGGVSIAFHPVLFAFPFVVNKLTPERLSAPILRAMFPHRNDSETPKFPAYYSGCRVAPAIRRTLFDIGFSDVWQVPFYGHAYYEKYPPIQRAYRRFNRFVSNRNITLFASYAYTIVRKQH